MQSDVRRRGWAPLPPGALAKINSMVDILLAPPAEAADSGVLLTVRAMSVVMAKDSHVPVHHQHVPAQIRELAATAHELALLAVQAALGRVRRWVQRTKCSRPWRHSRAEF